MKRGVTLVIALLAASHSFAQIGGQNSFEFLNIPPDATLLGLGGVNVSLTDRDPNSLFSNPALVSDSLNGLLSTGFLSYFADVQLYHTSFVRRSNSLGTVMFGFKYLSLGEIQSFDPSGISTGSFRSGEWLLTVGHVRKLNNFRYGATVNWIGASIANFRSSGLFLDLGGVFIHPERSLTFGATIKNLGVVLSRFDDARVSLPFDVRLGTTFKPEFMPFRFSFTLHQLNQYDIAYFDPNGVEEESGTVDKLFRHLTVGAEILFSKNFNIRLGYNHLVRQELKLEQTAGGAGFSYGLSFKIKAFEFAYSSGGYHAVRRTHALTLTTNTQELLRK